MDKDSDKPIDYGEHKYWDERYLKSAERFEWLADFTVLQVSTISFLGINRKMHTF